MDRKSRKKLRNAAERNVERIRQAKKHQSTLMSQTIFLGSLAAMLIIPVILGAYLGRWLDSLFEGYSVRWTVSLIILGVAIGAVNIYLFVRERP